MEQTAHEPVPRDIEVTVHMGARTCRHQEAAQGQGNAHTWPMPMQRLTQ